MRSKTFIIALAIAIGLLLFFMPIWPMVSGIGFADDFEHMRSHIFFFWRFGSMTDFYSYEPDIRTTTMFPEMMMNTNNLLSIIHPLVLVSLSWIIANGLQRTLIYLWDLP